MKRIIILALCLPCLAFAQRFAMPSAGNDVIGKIQLVTIQKGGSFSKIAKHFDISRVKLQAANPSVNPHKLRVGQTIVVPTRYILPSIRHGIVVNLTELRLYYFEPNGKFVDTFPVAVGRAGWHTPTANTFIYKKKKDPVWNAPKSIRDYMFKKYGKKIPRQVPSGPDNPLGYYAIYLGVPGILIHGNNAPNSIGTYASSGCIRMYNKDIEYLFSQVHKRMKVALIHHAIKLGWLNHKLFIEAHQVINKYEPDSATPLNHTDAKQLIEATGINPENIYWNRVDRVIAKHTGIPTAISKRVFKVKKVEAPQHVMSFTVHH